jgi:hypothetical protein
MRTNFKNNPTIKLTNLLGRRKTTLAEWVQQNGIFTYASLVERCNRLGVAPPDEREFAATQPPAPVSSPTEGVVVLPILPVISEMTGDVIEPEETIETQLIDERPGRRKRKE